MAQTPNTAKKVENFSQSQRARNNSKLQLNGRNIHQLTFNTPVNNTDIELKSDFFYYFTNDVIIQDDDIIEDSESNQYPVFLYNETQISIDSTFGLELKNSIAYLYPIY